MKTALRERGIERGRSLFLMKCRNLLVGGLVSGVAGCTLAYSPIIDGATSGMDIHVMDDRGESVADADVSVVYYITPEKVDVKRGKTDEQGRFQTSGRTIGEIHVLASKSGHYDSHLQPSFRLHDIEKATNTRKWAEGYVPVSVVLKRVLNPAELVVNGGDFQEKNWPATNTLLGFDLELFDWCPPYGSGKHDDLQLEYDFWRSSTNWFQVYSHLTMMMTNCVDGFYLAPVDDFSEMKRCYHADSNAIYQQQIEFVYDRKSGEVERCQRMPQDQYMVFRARTKTNDVGKVTSAHYGLIFEKGKYGLTWNIRAAFNPQSNDTNLEWTEAPPRK